MNKECYFTEENIYQKAHDMLAEIEGLRARHKQTLSRDHSALLILDMQRYFLEETSHAFIPAANAIISGIARLIEAYSGEGLPVIFTRHFNSEANAGMMARWWQGLIMEDDPLSEIIPQFDSSNYVEIEKSQYDAFYQTRLEKILRQQAIDQVVICGVMTHLCCETTARSAFVRGFEVFFPIDGTASYNEAFHRATLLNLAHGFAVPVLIDEIIAALSKSNES